MKTKVIDIVSTKTGEIVGYIKKTNHSEIWDLSFYVNAKAIHVAYWRTWEVLDYTRAVRNGKITDQYLLYRLYRSI